MRPLLLLMLVSCARGEGLGITGLRPSSGPYTGGDPVVIVGHGFQSPTQGAKVYFGKRAASSPVIMSDTEMRVEPPPGIAGESVDVTVLFDDARSGKLPKAYTYFDPIGKATP